MQVVDVIYPLGDITDPITGKKVVVGRYRYIFFHQNLVISKIIYLKLQLYIQIREHIEEDAKLFGDLKSMYKYDEAPERGITAGTRDFTDKKTYIKYSDDPKDYDPYAVNP